MMPEVDFENGSAWRAMRAAERQIFEDLSQEYGRPAGMPPEGMPELLRMPTLRGESCARFFAQRKNAFDWAKAVGSAACVLEVPMEGLTRGEDYDVWVPTLDIYIPGSIARARGVLHELGAAS
jgi:hypothetical protein